MDNIRYDLLLCISDIEGNLENVDTYKSKIFFIKILFFLFCVCMM